MVMTTASGNAAFLPSETGTLIIEPVIADSVASTISTVVSTANNQYRIPLVTADPSAGFVAEGAEIPLTDATLDEAQTGFFKVSGLTVISNELAADSSPAAAQLVGDGLARDIARKVDAAYFGNTTTDGPAGLKSLTTSTISAGSAYSNADPFISANYGAQGYGVTLGAFVTHPTTALALAKLKQSSGSNVPLLQPDVTQPGVRTIDGIPIVTSTAVDTAGGVVWGIPAARSYFIVREDATVESDSSVFFTSDRTAVRAVMRVSWLFPQPIAIQKISTTS